MTRYPVCTLASISMLVAISLPAQAGPDCIEGGTDAGSGRAAARVCGGVGPLGAISGTLSSARVPDFEDMYLIQITDPVAFSARTDTAPGATFDTQLWLFRLGVLPAEAFGILGNDEIPAAPAGPSRIQPPATDGTGQIIPGAGLYLLAISGFNNDPQSAGGAIFNQAIRTEVSGPDGPGGLQAHAGTWSGAGASGSYVIHLTGAALVEQGPVVPAVGPVGAILLGGLLLAAALAIFRRQATV